MALIPSTSSDPKAQLKWRWAVAIGMFLGFLSISTLGAWAVGYVPWMPRIATLADIQSSDNKMNQRLSSFDSRVTRIEQTTNAINLRLVKNDIQQALIDACLAQAQGNQSALARANAELYGAGGAEGLLDQFFQLTTHAYNIPPCSTLIIVPKPGH